MLDDHEQSRYDDDDNNDDDEDHDDDDNNDYDDDHDDDDNAKKVGRDVKEFLLKEGLVQRVYSTLNIVQRNTRSSKSGTNINNSIFQKGGPRCEGVSPQRGNSLDHCSA